MSRLRKPTPEQVIKSVNDGIDQVFSNAINPEIESSVNKEAQFSERYTSEQPVGIAGEDITDPEQAVTDIDLSSVIVTERKSPEGTFGIFQLTCKELGECEIRKIMIKFPVPAFNKCLRCNKLGVTIAR